MPIPLGGRYATFLFEVQGVDHQVSSAIGVTELDPGEPLTDVEMLTAVKEAWQAPGAPLSGVNIPDVYTNTAITLTRITVDGPLTISTSGTGVGSGAMAPVPINTALLIRKLTGLGGRRNQGRMYWPPCRPSESEVTPAGGLAPAAVAAISGYFGTALSEMLDRNVRPVLFHQTGDSTPTPVNGFTCAPLMATQRRRMR